MQKDTGPETVFHDTTGPASGIDGSGLEPAAVMTILHILED